MFRRIWKTFSILLCVGLLLATGLAIWQRQALADWWRLRQYEPPVRIAQLAEATTMTDRARHLFYVNRPTLDDKQNFNGHCHTTEQSIILGCFVNTSGIYIFDVKDARLDGIIEVTAAHETLHAAYERLSRHDRQAVDKLTSAAFADLKDERIKSTIELYRVRDPSVVPNELHSILGTEVRALPPELESYYQKYFTNRSKIVDYSDRYEQVFSDIKDKVGQYDARLAVLKKQLDANDIDLARLSQVVEKSRSELDHFLAANDIKNYNAHVPPFNEQVRAYNNLVNQTRTLVDEYNAIVVARNQLAGQQQELVQAINSHHTTVETQ